MEVVLSISNAATMAFPFSHKTSISSMVLFVASSNCSGSSFFKVRNDVNLAFLKERFRSFFATQTSNPILHPRLRSSHCISVCSESDSVETPSLPSISASGMVTEPISARTVLGRYFNFAGSIGVLTGFNAAAFKISATISPSALFHCVGEPRKCPVQAGPQESWGRNESWPRKL